MLRGYAARFDKPRWGDKRPSYYRDVALVRRLLPDAQFVHVVRDPRACLASLQRAPWYQRSSEEALSTWCMAVDLGQRWARRLGPQTWHEVQYEHLLQEPEGELRRLCAFLGEEFDPAMTHPEALAPAVVPRRKTWHDRTRTPLDPSRATAYRDELAPDVLALVSTVARDRMERYGYPVDPGRAPACRPAAVRPRGRRPACPARPAAPGRPPHRPAGPVAGRGAAARADLGLSAAGLPRRGGVRVPGGRPGLQHR